MITTVFDKNAPILLLKNQGWQNVCQKTNKTFLLKRF